MLKHPLTEIATDYHFNTERYDRLVCTGEIVDGEIRHRTGEEYRLINENARKELREARSKARGIGFTDSDIMKEINNLMMYRIFDYDRELEIRKINQKPIPIYKSI